jgi:ubiquinone/menaquinone biosynthesis C-methylase UbiE
VFPAFERLADPAAFRGCTVLEVGCGPGRAAEWALGRGAGRVVAIDADPRMVALAARRLRGTPGGVRVELGEASDTGLADATVDVALELQVLHHVTHWQAAIDELARVLRPGGSLLFEDSTAEALSEQWWSRTVLTHPRDNRFSTEQFTDQLQSTGLVVDAVEQLVPGRWFLGAAHRPGPPAPRPT